MFITGEDINVGVEGGDREEREIVNDKQVEKVSEMERNAALGVRKRRKTGRGQRSLLANACIQVVGMKRQGRILPGCACK